MSSNDTDPFLKYYTNEMAYLRQSGKEFARAHPLAAKQLDLSDKESTDPHTEKLIESVAFLTAKLHQHIDNSYGDIAAALFQVLYPTMTSPIPSMAIASFAPDYTSGRFTNLAPIAKGTLVYARSADDVTCRFQTIYPFTLTPLHITRADIVFGKETPYQTNQWYMVIDLTLPESIPLSLHDIVTRVPDLLVHLKGEPHVAMTLYESLFVPTSKTKAHDYKIHALLKKKDDLPQTLDHPLVQITLEPVGFAPHETMRPVPPTMTHAHSLIQDFFHFPDKFMFFKIKGLHTLGDFFKDQLHDPHQRSLSLYLPIAFDKSIKALPLTADHLQLNCCPIINLFKKTTDPLRLDYRKTEYPLIPDQRKPHANEIYHIESVVTIDETSNQATEIPCYFSMTHHQHAHAHILWYAKRGNIHFQKGKGSDMTLSFVDVQFNPYAPASHLIYAHTLCTNRDYASRISPTTPLMIDDALPLQRISFLNAPTTTQFTNHNATTLWRMISLLSSHHVLSLAHDHHHDQTSIALDTLKERLHLYHQMNKTSHHGTKAINDLAAIHIQPITRRVATTDTWRGFSQGLEVCLFMNAMPDQGGYHFLFASVLQHYFALSTPVNSFTETVLIDQTKDGEWMRWNPLHGITPLVS